RVDRTARDSCHTDRGPDAVDQWARYHAMKQAIAALVIAAAVSGLHAQPAPVVIRGRVVADANGEPLPHARVVIYRDATPLSPIFPDAQGRFVSVPLEAGRYRLSVTKSGYSLTAIPRIDPAGVDIRMPRSSAISGRVIDASGDP